MTTYNRTYNKQESTTKCRIRQKLKEQDQNKRALQIGLGETSLTLAQFVTRKARLANWRLLLVSSVCICHMK
jgi:hypothetical protein